MKDILSRIDAGVVSIKEVLPLKNVDGIRVTWPKMILSFAFLLTVAGALFATKTLTDINKNIVATKEAARPAYVKIVEITTPNCTGCFNVDEAVSGFKKLNIKVEDEKSLVFDSAEANESIKRFAIKKVPTYLVTGEITKNNIKDFVKDNGEVKDGTFIFTRLSPVFIDTETKQEMGKVTATLITDPSCSQCTDLKAVVENFKKVGVVVKNVKELSWNSLEAQRVTNQYKITKVPTFLFSSEFDLYDAIKATWPNIGTVEEDKTYVARNLPLPYRDLNKGQIVGLVDVVYLTDSGCADCYKVQDVQKPILERGFGIALSSERTVDTSSAEGRNLIIQYNITKVPTILLSSEVDQYSNLKNVWTKVGTVGIDGWHVFTGFDQLGDVTYKDLTTNQVIRPTQQPGSSPAK